MSYRFHSLTINDDTAAGTAVHVPGMLRASTPTNSQILTELTGANNMPTHIAFQSIEPVFEFDSFAIATLLAEFGQTGRSIASDSYTGVVLNFAKITDCGQIASGSVHRTLTIGKGCGLPTRITCDNRGDARMTVQLYALSDDGATAPVTIADNAALPTITIADLRWTLGPVDIGGVTFSDYNRFDLDFGNSATMEAVESAVYATHFSERREQPMLMIGGIDATWFASAGIPIQGLAATHANTAVYLKKRAQTASHFVADGTAEHVKFTLYGLANVENALNATAPRIGDVEIKVTAAKDGSGNSPLVITAQSAIT